MTEPQFIRERCLKLIRKPSMHEGKWSMTILDAVHPTVSSTVALSEDEHPIVSFYSQEDQWTLYTTHRLTGRNGGQRFEVQRENFSTVEFGNFKQNLNSPMKIPATMHQKERVVTFLYESGYASMAPIYYFKFWDQKWPVWQCTFRLEKESRAYGRAPLLAEQHSGLTLPPMEIDQPVWHLKGRRCDCCSGQGALCFSTCPQCGWVVLICDEVGTVFPDPRNLDHAVQCGFDDPSCHCPKCGDVVLGEFRNSTSEEIQNQGFQISDYE